MSQRRSLGLVLALMVGWLPVAPPEHVHEAEDRDGHEHVLVHRHLTAHGSSHHDSSDHDGTFDHGDEPILTLDTVYTVPASTTSLSARPSAAVAFDAPPMSLHVAHAPDYFTRPIHGPPRAPTGLRAPPHTSRL